jgi:hypothetical protein
MTEALAVVRTTGCPVTHMTLDVLTVLQPNTPVSPSEPGLSGGAEPKDESLESGFASVFAQLLPPATPGIPGQTLATVDALDSTAASIEAPTLSATHPETLPLELIVPTWMPTATPSVATETGLPSTNPAVTMPKLDPVASATSPPTLFTGAGDAGSPMVTTTPEQGVGLKSTWLTEGRMQLITPVVPSADTGTDSLVSFAQGQGLDDAALRRLFGEEFKSDASVMVKSGVISAAAWIAGGQRHTGLHNPVVDIDPGEPIEALDRSAMERAALSFMPTKRQDLNLFKAASAEAADQSLGMTDDGRLDLDLDLSSLFAELAPDADLKALNAEERVALALRIGEMLAQRLVAQVQRGQWQLRFA